MMRTTTKYVTKLIVAKPFTYTEFGNKTRTLRPGRVLRVRKHRNNFCYASDFDIRMGSIMVVRVPVEYLKVKWLKETTVVNVTTEEIPVK